MADSVSSQFTLSHLTEEELLVTLEGTWCLKNGVPNFSEFEQNIVNISRIKQVTFNADQIVSWDSGLIMFLLKVLSYCSHHHIVVDRSSLPDGMQRLLSLATAVPERQGARRSVVQEPWLARLGNKTMATLAGAREMVTFIGEASQAFGALLIGKARFRRSDLVLTIQECGAQALPIVSLISFLVGLILAFVGAVQLQQFGAQIYVANLVGLGMAREMGAMMTGIIMGGRTGRGICGPAWDHARESRD